VQLLELFLHCEGRAPAARETIRVDGDTVKISAWLAKARTKHRAGQLDAGHERLVAALFDGDWTDEAAAPAVVAPQRRNQEADLAALRKILARDSDEDRVTDAFRTWLLREGWTLVDPTDRWTDLEAVRGDERLICEAKGHTSEKGIDADIAYGQLLRRMTSQQPQVGYALVVPSSSVKAMERVPVHIRRLLRIDVYEVTDEDLVRRIPA